MEFSHHQLEITKQLSRKERDREIEAYQKLGLSFLCSFCREFLGTDDYKEFTKRRKKWIYEVRGDLTGKRLRVSLGSSRETEFLFELLMIPAFILTLFVAFLTKIYALLLILPIVFVIGGGILFDIFLDRLNSMKTKIRWLKKGKVRRILIIDKGHIHRELRE